jgi:hypothetical protein
VSISLIALVESLGQGHEMSEVSLAIFVPPDSHKYPFTKELPLEIDCSQNNNFTHSTYGSRVVVFVSMDLWIYGFMDL